MQSRREFIGTGFAAVALGLMSRQGLARGPLSATPPSKALALVKRARPITPIAEFPVSTMVDGLPFAPIFSGDDFVSGVIPFHGIENLFPKGKPPTPSETVDVAIVGGGLSGLTTAYLLRDLRPVVFELRGKFGGVSQGEEWGGVPYSLGGAYFIAPDKGSELEAFYSELGLDQVQRTSIGADPVELNSKLLEDFWTNAPVPPEEQVAFAKYAEMVKYFTKNYPDLPLDPKKDNAWILELDQKTLREDIEDRLGGPIPPLLAAGIQAYCHSSFTQGMEAISAASGWNFLAAEEFGRWVCPGGNSYVINTLWQRLVNEYASGKNGKDDVARLRANSRVVDVRPHKSGMIQLTWRDAKGEWRATLARKVVMACSKHVCKYMLHDLANNDPARLASMHEVGTHPYLVANVLLDAPITRDFYDIFMLRDGNFPQDQGQAALNTKIVDVLAGHFTEQPGNPQRTVLTLYWPLPFPPAMFHLIVEEAWKNFATQTAPQVRLILDLLKVPHSAVRQVRMTRWGHAMPKARAGFIAEGHADVLRSPWMEHVYFVNQDNWVLPAFETCVLEAMHFAPIIAQQLARR